MRKLFLYGLLMNLCISCIQEEPLNAEADIEECTIINVETGKADEHIRGNVWITNTKVFAQANPNIDLDGLALQVKLTEGATIAPDPTLVRDFSKPQRFEVTSQDGKWKKVYTVSIDTFEMPTVYDFEHFALDESGKYHTFYEVVSGTDTIFNQYIWASGNSGYALTGVGRSPEDYPTFSTTHGQKGRAVKLVTQSTGTFGEIAKMPIAAGNLFIGSFDAQNAMKAPLEATLFGLPFGKKPKTFTGYYKYKRGRLYTGVGGKGEAIPILGQDTCDIYAVLYEAEGLNKNSLNGADALCSDHIVAMARLKNPVVYASEIDLEEQPYQRFEIEFDYASYQKLRPFVEEKSKNYEYNLAVVFTTSRHGGEFEGAVGSTLYIDQVRIICE